MLKNESERTRDEKRRKNAEIDGQEPARPPDDIRVDLFSVSCVFFSCIFRSISSQWDDKVSY